jgi:hypothetical protein
MKRKSKNYRTILTSMLLFTLTVMSSGQTEKKVVESYLRSIPAGKNKPVNSLQKYRMTAVYINRDLYGNFTSKTKVSGDYTRDLPGDSVVWNNVYISGSSKFEEPFKMGSKQEYMENFKYHPSEKIVSDPQVFKSFPASPENVFARNLAWDMMAIEDFAWLYLDSLKLNIPYILPDIKGDFKMSDIGSYYHNKIEVTWKGISQVDNVLCAIIDFTAFDNKIEMNMDQISTKGTEQYWGTILLSLKTKSIEHAVMYGGTIQEIEVKGLKDKFLVKTIRDLEVNKIQ